MLPVLSRGFERGDDFTACPRTPSPHDVRIDLGGAQGAVVTPKMPHRCRVQAGIVLLDRAAVERFIVNGAGAQLEGDGVAVPTAVAADVVRIESRRRQRA